MKWLTRVTAAPAAQTGFFMDTGYRYPIRPGAPGAPVEPEDTKPLTELAVKSNITRGYGRDSHGTPGADPRICVLGRSRHFAGGAERRPWRHLARGHACGRP